MWRFWLIFALSMGTVAVAQPVDPIPDEVACIGKAVDQLEASAALPSDIAEAALMRCDLSISKVALYDMLVLKGDPAQISRFDADATSDARRAAIARVVAIRACRNTPGCSWGSASRP